MRRLLAIVLAFHVVHACRLSKPAGSHITGYNTGNDGTSIAVDSISGGSYPATNFSVGHGKDTVYGGTVSDKAHVATEKVLGGKYGPGSSSEGEPDWAISEANKANSGKPAGSHITGYSTGKDGKSIAVDSISGGSYPATSFSVGHGKDNVYGKPAGSHITGYNTGNDGTSIAVDSISGGSYPATSFSVGHGKDTVYGKPAGSHITGYNTGNDGTSIAVDSISGGSYPATSFSVGHGKDTVFGGTVSDKNHVAIGKVPGGKFGPGSSSEREPDRAISQANKANSGKPAGSHITGYSTGKDGKSIAVDSISGGSYPATSFSVGHGKDTVYGNALNGQDVHNYNIDKKIHFVEYLPPSTDAKKKPWYRIIADWFKNRF